MEYNIPFATAKWSGALTGDWNVIPQYRVFSSIVQYTTTDESV